MAAAIARLSDTVDVIGIVALDNPLIRHAVVQAIEKGVSVFTLLSDMSIPQRNGYIGLDNQKAGRHRRLGGGQAVPRRRGNWHYRRR